MRGMVCRRLLLSSRFLRGRFARAAAPRLVSWLKPSIRCVRLVSSTAQSEARDVMLFSDRYNFVRPVSPENTKC